MPKRKATTSIDMNGEDSPDEGVSSERDIAAKRVHSSDTPSSSSSASASSSSTSKLGLGGKVPSGELTNFASDLGDHFKSLNYSFVASIRQAIEKDPSICLVPIAQDYVTHSKALMTKYQKTSSNALNKSILPLDNTEEFLKMEKFLREQKSNGTTTPLIYGTPQQQIQLPKSSEHLLNGATATSGFSATNKMMFEFGLKAAGAGSSTSGGFNSNKSGGFDFTSSSAAGSSSAIKIGGFDFGLKPTGVGSSASKIGGGFEFSPKPEGSGSMGTLMPAPEKSGFFQFGGAGAKPTIGSGSADKSGGFDFNPKTDTSGSTNALGSSPKKSSGFEFNLKPGGASPSTSGSYANIGSGFQFNLKPPVPQTSRTDTPDSNPASADTDEQKDEENDEPPKNEFKPVVEDDALYSVRCKVFGMLKGGFKDKGIGQLFIKKLESEKYQVVVRADNNLGTILLNILLKEELPLKKKSAKDVLTVDPTGDDGKPLTIIIRVKDEALANELLEKLQHYAKQSNSNS